MDRISSSSIGHRAQRLAVDDPGPAHAGPDTGCTAAARRRPYGALHDLREGNLQKVLDVIISRDGVRQADIARATQLSPATVSNLVVDLRRRGLVWSDSNHGLLKAAAAQPGVLIGVDYGLRCVRVGIADSVGRLLAESTLPVPVNMQLQANLVEVRGMVSRLLARNHIEMTDVLQVGISLAAPIYQPSGRERWRTPTHSLQEWDLLQTPGKMFGLPVVVDRDYHLGALGELRCGAGRGCTDIVYLHADSRICVGLVLGGRLHRGAAGTAGEIGHTMVDPHGQLCSCGKRGCLDTVVGATGFLELLRGMYGEDLLVADVVDLAKRGDTRCRRALTNAGRALGILVADLCNLLSPQKVIVAGPIFGAGDTILQPLRETVEERAIPDAAQAAEVVPSALDGGAEMLGAVCLALDAVRARGPSSAFHAGHR